MSQAAPHPVRPIRPTAPSSHTPGPHEPSTTSATPSPLPPATSPMPPQPPSNPATIPLSHAAAPPPATATIPTQHQQYQPQAHPISPSAATAPPLPSTRPRPAPRRPQGHGALQDDDIRTLILRIDRYCQHLLDRVAPFKLYRWIGLTALLALFLLRMFLLEGFYIVAYVLFIFILNQFILFLQPKDRAALIAKATATSADPDAPSSSSAATTAPSTANGTGNNDEPAALPTFDDEEFRPFVRRLPEFKFWYSSTYATVIAFCATFFRCFDVPVFWPLLLFYFILLFVATMRRQWLDMKKLKYVPWDIGTKKVYKSDPKRVSVARNAASTTQSVQDVLAASGRAPPPVPTIAVKQKTSANNATAAATTATTTAATTTATTTAGQTTVSPPEQPVLT